MPDVTASYEMSLDFITFLANFRHNRQTFMSEVLDLYHINFVFDSQIVCLINAPILTC